MNQRLPLLRMGDDVVVTVQGDLHDEVAFHLQEDLLAEASRRPTRGVVLDISRLDVVDAFMGRAFAQLAEATRLLGVRAMLVGMRPEVAMTLVEFGISLEGVETALSLDRGFAKLSAAPA